MFSSSAQPSGVKMPSRRVTTRGRKKADKDNDGDFNISDSESSDTETSMELSTDEVS